MKTKRNTRRAEAKQRQQYYDSLTTTHKLEQIKYRRGESKKEKKKLYTKLLNSLTPDQHSSLEEVRNLLLTNDR